jgi:type IV fimbrial biogenesis protein FimT
MPTNGMNFRQAAGARSSKRPARAGTATAIERIFGDSGVYSSVPPRWSVFRQWLPRDHCKEQMMKRAKPTSENTRNGGFSLIEMLTVTGISATLVGAGVPALSAMVDRQTLNTTVNDLMLAIELGRSESVTGGSRVVLAPLNGNDWRDGWQLYRDLNDDGELDAGEPVLRHFGPPDKRIGFAAHGVVEDATMSFRDNGLIRRARSNGLMLGRLNVTLGEQVRTICFGAARVRVVANSLTCS